MPRRGYRKGVSDSKVPLGRRLHTRLPATLHARLLQDAESRDTTAARILRELAAAHYTGHRPELPQPRRPSNAALRELTRIGNNLNQIARQAHLMRLTLLEAEARHAVTAVLAAVARL
ncbi:MAG: MobC family plasmid mobilization relaxosome protein [Bradyrhizobium sp.]|uniref:MobC family plasmid mobilization relaxosome protein n=1 Tax=Bradyrhizobium sp. TaxID=376 RepID=UPI003D0A4458